MLELEVMPEKGLTNGQWELTLGMPLIQAIEILKSNYSTIKSVQLSYGEQMPLEQNILLDLTEDGIRLLFDSKYQRLKIIDIYDIRRVKLKYCNSIFSAPGITPTLEIIRQCFGPTRAGDRNIKQQLFLLLFRGIVFVFPLWNTGSSSPVFDADGLDFSEPSVEGSLILSRLRIFTGNNPVEAILPNIPLDCFKNHHYAEGVEGVRDCENGTITGLKINLQILNEETAQNRINGDSAIKQIERIINFSDSPQDVMSTLGSPDKVFYKDEDKMRIHSSSQHKQQVSNTSDYFFNYFTLGLDVLFDGLYHRVKKFVMHTNYPGHYNFNSYHRCLFSLSFPPDTNNDSQCIEVTAFTKWSEVQDYFTQPEEKPVVLSRSSSTNNTNPFGYTYCYNHQNVIFEVMKNSHIASVIVFKPHSS